LLFLLKLFLMKKIAVFPGSFDPITRGHESIILRAIPLFEEIIVAIGQNADKKNYFTLEQRINWIEHVFSSYPTVSVQSFKGLTVNFCKLVNANYILRGLRTAADFEFERSIGTINKNIDPGIETIFLLCNPEYTALNSSIVREIYGYGGDIRPFIPEGMEINH